MKLRAAEADEPTPGRYLKPEEAVTLSQIQDDIRPLGRVHNPAGLMASCSSVPESAFRFMGHWQREAVCEAATAVSVCLFFSPLSVTYCWVAAVYCPGHNLEYKL